MCVGGGLLRRSVSPASMRAHPAMATEFRIRFAGRFLDAVVGQLRELRGNRFHSGIDIKTQGVINKPIRAIADGTVVRIAVSPSGFGKALAINHPEHVRQYVYGHLERFRTRSSGISMRISMPANRSLDVTPPAGKFVFARANRSPCRATGVLRAARTTI